MLISETSGNDPGSSFIFVLFVVALLSVSDNRGRTCYGREIIVVVYFVFFAAAILRQFN